MKAVNNEKLLQDYEILANKKAQKLAEIEQEAKTFAIARGYDAERAAAFIEYVQKTENDGLADGEKKLFDVLGRYIVEVEEPVAAAVEADADDAEPIEE